MTCVDFGVDLIEIWQLPQKQRIDTTTVVTLVLVNIIWQLPQKQRIDTLNSLIVIIPPMNLATASKTED